MRSAVCVLRISWTISVLVYGAVIYCGIRSNAENRKYIPADVSKIPMSCRKAFVNVHASSAEDGIMCCESIERARDLMSPCIPKNQLPFLAGTLTTLRGAWLVPLIPILLRIVMEITSNYMLARNNDLSFSLRRLLLYNFVIFFRLGVLYLLFNSVGGYMHATESGSCWYEPYLKMRNEHVPCYGQNFDFSDHIVLFLGQTLPIVLFELLVSISFLPRLQIIEESQQEDSEDKNISKSQQDTFARNEVLNKALMAIQLLFFLYFNFVTLISAYKTAAFFHTPAEVLIGCLISLSVQLPLCYIIFNNEAVRFRNLIGFPTAGLLQMSASKQK